MVPKSIREVTPQLREGVNIQEMVESTVQRSLRVILGAQFTEKEGERLIARAYNPKLPPKVNADRVQRLLDQLQRAYDGKREAAAYYEANGTLQGFRGRTAWRMSDFDPGKDAPASKQSASPPPAIDRNPGARETFQIGGATVEILR
jgi:hypothetical protein